MEGIDLHKAQQTIKWIVYSLLLVNFGFYIYEDVDRAIHTLTASSTLLNWTSEFATTFGILAWFTLLAMFELETYQIDDSRWNRKIERFVHGARIVAYLMIAHTVLAYLTSVVEYSRTIPVEGVASLCELTERDYSYVYNLEYTEITVDNCSELTSATQFFMIDKFPLVVSADGLLLERKLVWSDLIEIVTWLLIIAAIEIVVRLQNHKITSGPMIKSANQIKKIGYLVLFGLAVFWGWLGHWLYTWDTFLWIAGFAVIEMNVNEWRDEIHRAGERESEGLPVHGA